MPTYIFKEFYWSDNGIWVFIIKITQNKVNITNLGVKKSKHIWCKHTWTQLINFNEILYQQSRICNDAFHKVSGFTILVCWCYKEYGFEHTLGYSGRQRGLACWGPWVAKGRTRLTGWTTRTFACLQNLCLETLLNYSDGFNIVHKFLYIFPRWWGIIPHFLCMSWM